MISEEDGGLVAGKLTFTRLVSKSKLRGIAVTSLTVGIGDHR